ncbi:hypothetical protein Pan181_43140 [Aeoliella mucimassa]|uniref:PEP-CTERM protein-sorting domain-containing protein n=2 Tax=Aeoliella mucimassa TaxID=2527972 RepID=A0A518ATN3_9BACT|nr:hypothetical protein Pan181_43140 [Aeoliella mucimassa]
MVESGADETMGIAEFNIRLSGLDAAGIDGGSITYTPPVLGGINEEYKYVGFVNINSSSVNSDRFGAGGIQQALVSNEALPIFNIGESQVYVPLLDTPLQPDDVVVQSGAYLGAFIFPDIAEVTIQNFSLSIRLFPNDYPNAPLQEADSIYYCFDCGWFPTPKLSAMAVDTELNSLLLDAITEDTDGSILLTDALRVTNNGTQSYSFEELGDISSSVLLSDDLLALGFTGTVLPGSSNDTFSLALEGPFDSLGPDRPFAGSVDFDSIFGGSDTIGFSVSVPEPSALGTATLALVFLTLSYRSSRR